MCGYYWTLKWNQGYLFSIRIYNPPAAPHMLTERHDAIPGKKLNWGMNLCCGRPLKIHNFFKVAANPTGQM